MLLRKNSADKKWKFVLKNAFQWAVISSTFIHLIRGLFGEFEEGFSFITFLAGVIGGTLVIFPTGGILMGLILWKYKK